MASSKIEITFNCDLSLNETVEFERQFNDGTFQSVWISTLEQWKSLRTGPGQVSIGLPTATPGERSAINYAQALELDMLLPIGYSIDVIGNMVRITHSTFWQFRTVTNGSPACVDIVVSNFNSNLFYVDNIEYVPATTNPVCSHYKVILTTSELSVTYTLDGTLVTGNTNNPIEFEVLRGVGFGIICVSGDGQTISQSILNIQAPPLFTNNQVQLQINASPNGATVVATVIALSPVVDYSFTFSLDGTNFQASNTFSGLVNGDYTMTVKDSFGCTQTVDFTVTDANIVNAFHYISESMSIRFAERVTEGVCGPYKTDRQRLSCEEFAEDPTMVYREFQKRQTCDTLTTQFLSNFQDVIATVIRENGDEETLTVNKMTENIGRKDSRDARRYNLGNGKTGIYFLSGNLYDYDTGVPTGDTYILNGGLPEWGRIGYYIHFAGAWFQIDNIYFDESRNADVLVINASYTGPEVSVIARSIFNREVYEVYEFSTPMASYNDECIQIRIDHQDPNFTNVSYLSEVQDVKVSQPGTVEIVSYNDKNTDVFYKTGIKHQVRAEIISINGDHDGDSEVLKSDTKSDLLSADLYQLEQFVFKPTSKGIYRQLIQLLTHKFVAINGEAFVKNDTIEKDGPLGTSNQYQIKASMLRSNTTHTTQISGAETVIINPDDNIEVPNFIAPETDEFISY